MSNHLEVVPSLYFFCGFSKKLIDFSVFGGVFSLPWGIDHTDGGVVTPA